MTDSLQASSSNPLPFYQTVKGTQDPLPTSSPLALHRSLDAKSASEDFAKADDFKSYLDRSSISVVEKHNPGSDFDPAAMIAHGSIYVNPDGLRPI